MAEKKKLSAYNRYMRKALKGKLKGKTKAQRKAIFRTAAKGWKKGKSVSRPRARSRTRSSPSRTRNPKVGSKRMAKGFLNERTIFSLLRKVALVAPAAARALAPGESPYNKLRLALADYTGFNLADGTWRWDRLIRGYAPYVVTKLATYGIEKLGGMIRRI